MPPDLASAVLRHALNPNLPAPIFDPALPLDLIDVVKNVRGKLADLDALRDSISIEGVHTPIDVIRNGTRYKLWRGHRRVEAAKQAGLTAIPALIYNSIDPADFTKGQLIENLLRADMSDLDTYLAVVELESLGMARKDIGASLGKSPSQATRYFAPDECPTEAKEHFLKGDLTLGQMYRIKGSEEPLVTMGMFLSGATHKEAGKTSLAANSAEEALPDESNKDAKTNKSGKGGSLKIALSDATILIKGNKLSLPRVVELLGTALRDAEKSNKDGLTAKSFCNVMSDRAKKKPDQPKPKGKKAASGEPAAAG